MSHRSREGYADIVIGLQHGDEAKGKCVDGMAGDYDAIVRYNGGANAGHTITFGQKTLALHQLPSGVNHPNVRLYIGALCVVNLEKLVAEIEEVESHGIRVRHRLRISPYASIIQPGHIVRDIATMKAIGTTKNGIGPAYADTHARIDGTRRLDWRMGDLKENFTPAIEGVRKNFIADNDRYHEHANGEITAKMGNLERAARMLLDCIDDNPESLIDEWRANNRILLEGAQAAGLDVTFGTTPSVTASNTGVQAALLSTSLPPEAIRRRIGVAKAIPSRVGRGPFVTEFGGRESEEYCMAEEGTLHSKEWEKQQYGSHLQELLGSSNPLEMGKAIRVLGGEYGASTGRPRRVGALDLVHLRSAIRRNGIEEVCLSKVDQLSHLTESSYQGIPVANHYVRDGRRMQHMPTTEAGLYMAEPELHVIEGWSEDLSAMREQSQLPELVSRFIMQLQDRIHARIFTIGVGPDRDQCVRINE